MRIAQVPPLYEAVPPLLYGGTERVVSYLTEELVNQGHEVTLFGTKDSITKSHLFPVSEKAIRLNPDSRDPLAVHYYQLQEVMEHASEFDIIHFHTDYLHFPISNLNRYCQITTLHGRLDMEDLKLIYEKFGHLPLVSISNSQRIPFPDVNWVGTVYHGLPKFLYRQGSGEGGYLAFLGRISPEKRPDRAIEIAIKAGIPLKIAAKIDRVDQEYFELNIKHLLAHPLIEYIGEINEQEKQDFLGNALALLFPIDWPEPFGIVLIESLATGTPVIAWRNGSVPEIIDDGKTGFIVNSIEGAVRAVQQAHLLSRDHCRRAFEKHFTSFVMAGNYLKVYEKICNKRSKINGYSEIKKRFGNDNYILKNK